MLKGARGRRGFTLLETVVTVGIVATLAAVVYPQVVKQFDSADPTKAAEDLNSIRTAIEIFGVNVRPQQPGDIEDLVNRPGTAAPDLNIRGTVYSLADAAAWNGPYLGLSIRTDPAVNDVVLTTGFGATIPNGLTPYDLDLAGQTGGGTAGTVATADFVAVRISGLSGVAFNALNTLIDGPNEVAVGTAAPAATENRRTLGRLRCPYPTTPIPLDSDNCPVAYFLAAPFRQ